MTIEFEPLATLNIVGVADGSLLLMGNGNTLVPPVGDGYGDDGFILGDWGYGIVLGEGEEPEIPVFGDGGLVLGGEAEGALDITGEADEGVALGDSGFGNQHPGAVPSGVVFGFADNGLALDGEAFELAQPTAYAILMEQTPFINATSGAYHGTIESDLLLADMADSFLIHVISESLRLQDQFTYLGRFAVAVEESLVLRDFVTIVWVRQVNETLVLNDLTEAELRLIALVAEALAFTDEGTGYYNALVTVASALVLRDRLAIGRDVHVNEALVLNDETEAAVRAIVEAVSALTLADEASAVMHLFALVSDTFSLTTETTGLVAALAEVLDTINFGVRVRVGDEVIVGYAMNTRLAAVSEYENYGFLAMAMVGGKPYGIKKGGVFRLEGADDDGDPIVAHVRTGILNFEYLTHVPNAWIGYTSDGELVFKTITMDKGVKKENWKRMKARPDGAPVESRFDIAKGLIGTYWAFEIENLDGADFELDIVKIWPLRTQRRYSGR